MLRRVEQWFTGVDPLARSYPWNSTYAFAENDVIRSIDLDGLERLVVNHYRWNLDGSTTELGITIYDDGQWRKGNQYREWYQFTTKEGETKHYWETKEDLRGTAMLKMREDNPAYFHALKLYHDHQLEKTRRVAGDGLIIVGGIVTTVVSGGTGTAPYTAAFGITSGIFATGAGGGKLAFDIMGDFGASDQVPTSVLGSMGRTVDELAQNDGQFTFEMLGDIANGGLLFIQKFQPSNWSKLEYVYKVLTLQGVLDALIIQSGNEVDPSQSEEDVKFILDMMEYYNQIKESGDGG